MFSRIYDALKRFWQNLFARKPFPFDIFDFPRYDLDEIEHELRVKEEAIANGKRNNPPTSSHTLDYVESKIVQYFKDRGNEAFNLYKRRIQHLDSQIRNWVMKAHESAAALQVAGQNASVGFDAYKVLHSEQLRRFQGDLTARNQELKTFKEKHKLDRLADYPESMTLRYGLLAILITVESVLNGSLIATGHELGLFGGSVIAFGLSLFNVGVGFICGYGAYRYIHYRAMLAKIYSVAGVAGYLLLIAVINLGISHYREASMAVQDNPSAGALRSLTNNPLSLGELESWMLFGMGVVFSLIAFFDGVHIDDPYPGYGKRDRLVRELEQELQYEQIHVFHELQGLRDQKSTDLEKKSSSLDQYKTWASEYISKRDQWTENFKRHIQELEHSCSELLRRYQSYNRHERSEPPPAYFDSTYQMAQFPLEPASYPQLPTIGPRTVGNAMESIARSYRDAVRILEQVLHQA